MEWSYDDEVDLLSLVCDYKPAGARKIEHVNAIVSALNQRSHNPPLITPGQVWDKLKSWYNLPLLDQLEESKSDSDPSQSLSNSEPLSGSSVQPVLQSLGLSRRSLRTKPAGSVAADVNSSLDENEGHVEASVSQNSKQLLLLNKRKPDSHPSPTPRKKLTRATVKRDSEASDHGISPKRRQKRGVVPSKHEPAPALGSEPGTQPKPELTLDSRPEPDPQSGSESRSGSEPDLDSDLDHKPASISVRTLNASTTSDASLNLSRESTPVPIPEVSHASTPAPSPPRRITRRKAHADEETAAIEHGHATPKRASNPDTKQPAPKVEKTEHARRSTPSPAKTRRASTKTKAPAVPVRRSTRRK